ncbi:ATP-binding protein [Lactiplantibacillus plantarum]|uniref:ATP-binding protein n=1 Tax=Lactiplantibacillus plantarum TaxID=1590 RepID=UPI00039E2EDA|nr:ATP-binding protein [Lactiplantibacillus plantarum]
MTSNETKRKLREMRLNAMVEILEIQEQQPEYQQMDFEDKFELIVDGAYARQQSNKLSRLLHSADFPSIEPALAEVDYLPDRKLDRKLIQKLATGSYIREHHNIILMGASGNGKTWLANALGIEACRQFYKVKYVRLPELLDDLAVAKHEANGNFHKILTRYKKVARFIIKLAN